MLSHPWLAMALSQEVDMAYWVRKVWDWRKPSRRYRRSVPTTQCIHTSTHLYLLLGLLERDEHRLLYEITKMQGARIELVPPLCSLMFSCHYFFMTLRVLKYPNDLFFFFHLITFLFFMPLSWSQSGLLYPRKFFIPFQSKYLIYRCNIHFVFSLQGCISFFAC